MAFVPYNNNGITTPASSAPVVLSTGTTGSVSRALTTLNYDFITNTTNGWYDTMGFNWVSLTVYGQASASATVTFEACNETITGALTQVFLQDASSSNPSRTATYAITANTGKIFEGTIPARYFRVRVSTTGAGTASVYGHWRQSPTPTTTPVIGPLVTGSNLFGSTLAGISSVVDVPSFSVNNVTTTSSGILHTTPTYFALAAGATPAASFNLTTSSVTGTSPAMDVVIQESYDDGANWTSLYQFERISAAGTYTTPVLRINGNALRYYYTASSGSTSSFTVAITRMHKSSIGVNYRNLYDRTFNTTQTSGVTGTSFYVLGTSSVQMTVSSGPASTVCSMQLQGSTDGINWLTFSGSTVSPAANTTATGVAIVHNVKWVRAVCGAAGVSQTLNFVHFVAQGA